MLSVQSNITIADSTGIKLMKCIKIIRSKYAMLGSVVVGSIKKVSFSKKYKKGQILRVIVLRSKKISRRLDGSFFKFYDNSGIVQNSDKGVQGQKIKGPIPILLRKNENLKLFSKTNRFI